LLLTDIKLICAIYPFTEMAENWTDPNTEPQEIPDDPISDAEPDDATQNDATGDAAKPKRNRLPTAGQLDAVIDDGNADDAPKPKRGRGRPRKDEDTPLPVAMKKELDDIKRENARLSELLHNCKSEKADIENDLELTRSSLLEREHDYADLIEQFSKHEENSASQAVSKPNGIVFYDNITEPCVTKLKSNITWNKIKKGLSEIDDSDGIQNADVILLVTGACEIAEGASAFKLINC
jgi:hypothetical protein